MISLFIHYLSKIADWQSKSQFLKLFFNQRIFFRGLHVAGHGKILPGVSFSSSTQNNKFDWKWNPRESWNYFYFQTLCDSGKCCNFQVFCDPGKEHSAILPRRGNKQKAFRLNWTSSVPCNTHRTNEFTCSLSLPNEPTSSTTEPAYHDPMCLMYQSNRSFNIPPGHTPGIWRLFLPGRREFD